jgi:hypothetical protein
MGRAINPLTQWLLPGKGLRGEVVRFAPQPAVLGLTRARNTPGEHNACVWVAGLTHRAVAKWVRKALISGSAISEGWRLS